MAKYPFNSRRSRMNPVGQDSYVDSVLEYPKSREIKDADGYPELYGYSAQEATRARESGFKIRPRQDRSIPGTAQKPAALAYANRIFRVQTLTPVFLKGKGAVRLKGGLASYLDGWTEEDEANERQQDSYKGQYNVTPRKSSRVEKGETTVDYWSGGFAALMRLGANWLTDPLKRAYEFSNLAPWSPENPQGTGVWRDIGSRILTDSVRGDEAFAASWLLRNDISTALRKFTRNQVKEADLKPILQQAFSGIMNCIYGSDLKVDVDAANERGIARLKLDAAEKDEYRAARAAGPLPSGGRTTSAAHHASLMERAQRTGRATDPRLAPSRPAAEQVEPTVEAPPAVVRAVETAAAAVTAPVTPSAPAAAVISDALQALLDLGLSMAEAQKVMAKPPAERVKLMLVLMGN